MATQWKKDKEDDVLVVLDRQFGSREVEVLRVNGLTGEVKFSRPMSSPTLNKAVLTIGAEGAVAANAIEVKVAIKNSLGAKVTGVRAVKVRTLAVTDSGGDIAAAGTPVGTLKKAVNPLTGFNEAWFETTAAGLLAFSTTNAVAETQLLEVHAAGCEPVLVKLTFA